MKDARVRKEVLAAEEEIAKGNPWYTSDQLESHLHGVYRHNMKLRYAYVQRHLRNLKVEGRTLLDLGCGDGQWSMEVSRNHRVNLIGVDYNKLRLERYRQNVHQADARFGSCLDIPLEDRSVDAVMFHQVLEHLREPERALREIRRVLKPGGWLLLSVPNEGTWLKQRLQYRWLEPRALESSDHINFYTRDSLASLLESNGFNVTRLDAVGFYFPHNGISRRLLSNKLSFNAGIFIARLVPGLRDCLFAWCRVG